MRQSYLSVELLLPCVRVMFSCHLFLSPVNTFPVHGTTGSILPHRHVSACGCVSLDVSAGVTQQCG